MATNKSTSDFEILVERPINGGPPPIQRLLDKAELAQQKAKPLADIYSARAKYLSKRVSSVCDVDLSLIANAPSLRYRVSEQGIEGRTVQDSQKSLQLKVMTAIGQDNSPATDKDKGTRTTK